MSKGITKRKVAIFSIIAALAIGGSAMAAAFTFSFTTSSATVGGVGYKNAASTGGVLVNAYDANLNNSRYISLFGATNAGTRITEYGTINNAYTGAYLTYTNKNYSGNLHLWGNPSTVGASAMGEFYP